MGLLKTIGKAFIEEVPTTEEYTDIVANYPIAEEVVDAELDSVNTSTLIDDIYVQNDLADRSQSIFKVEELIESLPKEMVNETKRASVLAILGSFNLTATGVCDDGEKRVKILDSVNKKIKLEGERAIEDKELQIEELKKSIATLSAEIVSEQEKMKSSNEIITKEIERIDNLVEFIGGVN